MLHNYGIIQQDFMLVANSETNIKESNNQNIFFLCNKSNFGLKS